MTDPTIIFMCSCFLIFLILFVSIGWIAISIMLHLFGWPILALVLIIIYDVKTNGGGTK